MSHSKDIGVKLKFLTACIVGCFVRVQTNSMLLVGHLEAASFDKDYGLVISLRNSSVYGMVKIFWKDIVFVDVKNAYLDLDKDTLLNRCIECGLTPSLPKDFPTYRVHEQRPTPIAQLPPPEIQSSQQAQSYQPDPQLQQRQHNYGPHVQSSQQAQSYQQVPQLQQRLPMAVEPLIPTLNEFGEAEFHPLSTLFPSSAYSQPASRPRDPHSFRPRRQ